MVSPSPAGKPRRQTSLSTRTSLNHFNALTTACILLEHIQTLERLRDETQHRVEAKRQTLHFLETITPKRRLRDALSESIVTQQQMQNTPTSTRSRYPSPRLRGLYDVHGPGCANRDSLQTTADFSPLSLVDLSIYGRDHEVVWEDDDDEALLCPSADEAVEDYAGSGNSSKESCDQLACLASLHLVSSSSRIIFEAQEPDRVSASTKQASNRYRSIVHGKKSPSGVKGKGVVRRGSSKRNNVGQSRAKRAFRRILHHKKLGADAIRFHE